MTAAERTSRWARRFVVAGAAFLLVWQAAALAGLARRTTVTLALLGFVFHTVFGKAYSLVPTYFDRSLATTWLMPVHLALSVAGTTLLAAEPEVSIAWVGPLGAACWALGVAVFVGTIGWTIRDNPTGGETGTGEANAHRRRVDRLANAVVPLALAYLAVGSYQLLADATGLPAPLSGYPPRTTHVLAAGAATLVLLGVGFRLLPRFLVAEPPLALVAVVLPTGAIGPAILAVTLPAGRWFALGAAIEAVAVVGFAAAVGITFTRSDRRRIGFYGVVAGMAAGVLAALLGLHFATGGPDPSLVAAHMRLNLLGFLGLTIVGVTYQFYPPAVGTFAGAGDRTAGGAMALLAGGLLVEVIGHVAGVDPAVTAGHALAILGAAIHLYLLAGLFRERYG